MSNFINVSLPNTNFTAAHFEAQIEVAIKKEGERRHPHLALYSTTQMLRARCTSSESIVDSIFRLFSMSIFH